MRPLQIACLAVAMALLTCCSDRSQVSRIIWFDSPATFFEEAFPLGNGRIGMMIHGDPFNDIIVLNEESLWAGGPVDPYMNPDAWKYLDEVREALFREDYQSAERIVRNIQGKFSESYAPLGDLYFSFSDSGTISEYCRNLDIRSGISTIQYKLNDVSISREAFISYPDQVAVLKFTASDKALSFGTSAKSLLKFNTSFSGTNYYMDGLAPVHAEPSYRGDIPDAIVYDTVGKGMRYRMIVSILENDGILTANDEGFSIEDASEVILLVSIATSYNGFDKDPGLEGKDERSLAEKILSSASLYSYKELKRRHREDFTDLFDRVEISLNYSSAPDLPINERLKAYTAGSDDPDLEALYFQFGRYLLISSSRPGGIPANLQGIWNHHLRPPWSSNYTANINSEMNYWPAEVTNLSETHMPLLEFIERLSITGAVTAKTFYNCRGWCCSHNSDIWAMTNPVGDFGKGHPVWANWSMAGPWYCLHLYEHFAFTCDTVWLRDYAWPLMKGAARFCLDYLVEGPDGYLVTAPSTSPENEFLDANGIRGSTLYGSTSDMALIRGLFNKIIEINRFLDREDELINEVISAIDYLYPYQIGEKGNLQEWYHDWQDRDPHHRHISHLIGLYPDNQISPTETPDLADAARRSLELRGDGGTGWSKAWKINAWARLLDGNHAYDMLRAHLTYSDPDPATQYTGGGTFPNLLDSHPPFQIDGNFGGTSGIAEMLLQSHNGEIHLLPALPDRWSSGYINGLRARGGFTVDQKWSNNELLVAIIIPDRSCSIQIRYRDQVKRFDVEAGIPLTINSLNF